MNARNSSVSDKFNVLPIFCFPSRDDHSVSSISGLALNAKYRQSNPFEKSAPNPGSAIGTSQQNDFTQSRLTPFSETLSCVFSLFAFFSSWRQFL
jgi:hypothetical protein